MLNHKPKEAVDGAFVRVRGKSANNSPASDMSITPIQSIQLIASWLIDPLICPCLAANR